ncbi:protein gamma response 1-like [Dorcoceras hygrometricum]|uniref:Protein gamma response 1-like n=1 Tax=Dorcoceras hygrometricum TaxID=472368 RepID=A0A2Z7B388_9LAMI|nr:protein gamma response 1-like [Dorcoceras hygrometricum]
MGSGRPCATRSATACASIDQRTRYAHPCMRAGRGRRTRRRPVANSTCVTLNGSGIQLAMGPQPLWLRNHNSGPAQRIMVKRLSTPHDPLGITDSACKNQSVVVSVLYGPFNPYIPIRSTTIGKSRVSRDPIAMHTSWRSNSDIASVTSIGYPRMSASGESSTTMHRLLHASGSHPIPTPGDPKTNQYNQDLGLIHSTNGNHLESPKEGSSIDHQVTIYLHAQNITMFPTNETCASVTADFMDVKKAVRELNAKVDAVSTGLVDVRKDLEATKEAISHQLLEFQAQAQANHNILTDQLSELVNYINKGGNDKNGEGSSRGPQPPPDDHNRGSGNTGGGGDNSPATVNQTWATMN